MSIVIENLVDRPVTIHLNSGQALHFLPGAKSPSLDNVEVERNEFIQKLVNEKVISLRTEVIRPVEDTSKDKEKSQPVKKSKTE